MSLLAAPNIHQRKPPSNTKDLRYKLAELEAIICALFRRWALSINTNAQIFGNLIA